jgi:hypothetical protein
MPTKSANLFRLLPESPDAVEAPSESPLAQALIERCLDSELEAGSSALRASCVAVRMARRMLWPSRLLDIVHLACLGRQDRSDNREAWSLSANPILRMVVRECEDNPDLLTIVRLALLAERLVREDGVFHGIDTLMRQRAPEAFLDAAWDLRYDGQTWMRLEDRPAHESILHAGRLGLSSVSAEDRAAIPIPAMHGRKVA